MNSKETGLSSASLYVWFISPINWNDGKYYWKRCSRELNKPHFNIFQSTYSTYHHSLQSPYYSLITRLNVDSGQYEPKEPFTDRKCSKYKIKANYSFFNSNRVRVTFHSILLLFFCRVKDATFKSDKVTVSEKRLADVFIKTSTSFTAMGTSDSTGLDK